MDEHEITSLAAEKAVHKVFAILGVDTAHPEQIEAFREDLRFGRKVRKWADHGALAVISLLVIAMGAALWAGIVSLAAKAGVK